MSLNTVGEYVALVCSQFLCMVFTINASLFSDTVLLLCVLSAMAFSVDSGGDPYRQITGLTALIPTPSMQNQAVPQTVVTMAPPDFTNQIGQNQQSNDQGNMLIAFSPPTCN